MHLPGACAWKNSKWSIRRTFIGDCLWPGTMPLLLPLPQLHGEESSTLFQNNLDWRPDKECDRSIGLTLQGSMLSPILVPASFFRFSQALKWRSCPDERQIARRTGNYFCNAVCCNNSDSDVLKEHWLYSFSVFCSVFSIKMFLIRMPIILSNIMCSKVGAVGSIRNILAHFLISIQKGIVSRFEAKLKLALSWVYLPLVLLIN